jgi:chromate reductase
VKYIISGTNRPGSRTRQISNLIQKLYAEQGEKVEIIDLLDLPFQELTGHQYGGAGLHLTWEQAVQKINQADGLILVTPEYNGSMPGALKYFIDHWVYPDSFEFRPICFVGLGGLFGGIRPVEHLQQVMGYRNAFQYPLRIFLMNVFKTLQNGELQDPTAVQLLKNQVVGFQKFVKSLQESGLDANSVLRQKKLTSTSSPPSASPS